MTLAYSILPAELLSRIHAAISGELQVYLVGGAVRDALLGKASYDLDFTLANHALETGRRVANQLDADFYPLDLRRDIGRVIFNQPDGRRWKLDFAGFQGHDLISDLHNRDFTVNAMALSLQGNGTLIDPLGGAHDLKERVLRACSNTSFLDDPVRILRAFRQSADFELKISSQTKALLRQALPLLAYASIDRLRDELFRILEGSRPVVVLRGLDIVGALGYILPELIDLKSVPASPPHINDAFTHTLDAVQRLLQISQALSLQHDPETSANWAMGLISMQIGRYRQQLHEHLAVSEVPGRSLIGVLLFAALHHDIVKPAARTIDERGGVHFKKHEILGAQTAFQRAKQLRLSNSECERITIVVKNHMRPLFLAQTGESLSRRSTYRFFQATGEAGVDICLLSLADTLATYGPSLPQATWTRQLGVVRALLEAWWERQEEVVFPINLINGNELMEELDLKPGPLIGLVLNAVREAQASGEIHTRLQALDFAKKYILDSQLRGGDDFPSDG